MGPKKGIECAMVTARCLNCLTMYKAKNVSVSGIPLTLDLSNVVVDQCRACS